MFIPIYIFIYIFLNLKYDFRLRNGFCVCVIFGLNDLDFLDDWRGSGGGRGGEVEGLTMVVLVLVLVKTCSQKFSEFLGTTITLRRKGWVDDFRSKAYSSDIRPRGCSI